MNKQTNFPHITRIYSSLVIIFKESLIFFGLGLFITMNVLAGINAPENPDAVYENKSLAEARQLNPVQQVIFQEEAVEWKSIAEILPGYQYAFLKLAVLHRKLEQPEMVKSYVEEAVILDPTNPLLLNVRKDLREAGEY